MPKAALESLVDTHGFDPRDVDELAARLKTLTTRREGGLSDLLDGRGIGSSNSDTPPLSYVDFWMDLFSSLRAEEQYVALRAVDELPLGEFAGVDLLRGQFTGARSVRACTWHRMNPSADMHFLGGRVTSVVIERWCKSVAPMGNGRVGGAGVCTAPKVPFHERRASRSRQRTQEVGYRNREIQYFGYRGKSANAQDRICLGFAGFLW